MALMSKYMGKNYRFFYFTSFSLYYTVFTLLCKH